MRDAALRRCEEKTWAAVAAGDHRMVLLEFLGSGYGASVAVAWAMRKDRSLNGLYMSLHNKINFLICSQVDSILSG